MQFAPEGSDSLPADTDRENEVEEGISEDTSPSDTLMKNCADTTTIGAYEVFNPSMTKVHSGHTVHAPC